MKKSIILLAFVLLAFTPEKKYRLELNDSQLGELWNVIENSNAPHLQVKEIQDLIQQQLKSQIDTVHK